MLWLISANPKVYNTEKAFSELNQIDWRKNASYNVGDYIFIYVNRPVQSIKYLCKVIEINVDINNIINDKKYWIDSSTYDDHITQHDFIRLQLVKTLDFNNLSINDLHEHELIGNIQGPRKMINENNQLYSWAKYIIKVSNSQKYFSEALANDKVLTVPINGTLDLIEKYKVHAHPLKGGYPSKKTNFIAFREPGGIINDIYEVLNTVDIIPDEYLIDDNISKYIISRKQTFGFSEENTQYRFYILNHYIKLQPSYILTPNPQGSKYINLNDLINSNQNNQLDSNYIQFWTKFEKKAFENKDYASIFQKSDTLNRANYLVSLNDNDKGIVLRKNSENNCIELYIRKKKEIFDYYKKNINLLESNLYEKFNIPKQSIDDTSVNKKFILEYPYKNIDDETFINWAIKNCIIIKKNIDLLDKNMNEYFETDSIEDDKLKKDLSNIKKEKKHFEYDDKLSPKPKQKEIHGIKVYIRDKQKAVNALNHANYSCEIDKNHKVFFRKDGITPYTEAHHLVPLSYQDKYEYSLDIEENIVSLCSNCHNEIHYGFNAKELIKQLYNQRKNLLTKKGIEITLEELYQYYGY